MRKSGIMIVLFFVLASNVKLNAQIGAAAGQDNRMGWWREARFGMFIHWGLYAVPAGEWNGLTGYGEWIRTSAEIPLDVYDKFRPRFNPVGFNADDWVKTARDAGMKYIVITSKHHDGFCMFDTKQTDFNIMSTPFRRDPMKELASACKKYGLKFCFYHSIMDWHHPDYLPRREWEKDRTTAGADYERYIAYMKAQLKELLTNYGEIGVLWFDGEWEGTWNEQRGRDLYYYVRGLQPSIIINNRVGAGRLDMEGLTREGAFGGDFGTPEQQIPATGLPGMDWETCMTMNDHWGYNKADKHFKSDKELIRMLADIASKGGNFLLNVGPTAEGKFPQESLDRLTFIGRWMKTNGEAVYGTTASPFRDLGWGRCTRRDTQEATILYLHVFDWPAGGLLTLDGLLNEPLRAYLLSDPKKRSCDISRHEDALTISVPLTAPDTICSVVVLEIKGKPDMTEPPVIGTGFTIFADSILVPLSTDREQVDIRYTINGGDPSATSQMYRNPIRISETTMLKARCFRKNIPVSGTVTREFTKVEPLKAMIPDFKGSNGIRYAFFEGNWDSLPDFSHLKPSRAGIIEDFLLTPKTCDEYFGFVYSGFIRVPATDVYLFSTRTDDGSKLYIDGRLVVNNDLLHSALEKYGLIVLEKGIHRIEVTFFEKTGNESIEVWVSTPVLEKQKLPAEWLYINDQ